MIHYRTFRNNDPPALVDLWNACFTGRGAASLRGTILLEYFAFAKPYFDREGLVLAIADDQIVGFVLAGFGPNAEGNALDHRVGVTCVLGVAPAYRRQGIGTELLRRGEDYLRRRGAVDLYAGPLSPRNPFTFGIYGGSDSPGFLESDALARPFLERRGYRVHETSLIWHRSLGEPLSITDARFAGYRQAFDIYAGPLKTTSWWRECVLGPVELHEYRLQDRATSATAARLALWEMETFGPRWNEHVIGVADFEVAPESRRKGLAKFFLMQVMRHLHDQFFTLMELQTRADNEPALNLLQFLGFRQVDRGYSFKRDAQ